MQNIYDYKFILMCDYLNFQEFFFFFYRAYDSYCVKGHEMPMKYCSDVKK